MPRGTEVTDFSPSWSQAQEASPAGAALSLCPGRLLPVAPAFLGRRSGENALPREETNWWLPLRALQSLPGRLEQEAGSACFDRSSNEHNRSPSRLSAPLAVRAGSRRCPEIDGFVLGLRPAVPVNPMAAGMQRGAVRGSLGAAPARAERQRWVQGWELASAACPRQRQSKAVPREQLPPWSQPWQGCAGSSRPQTQRSGLFVLLALPWLAAREGRQRDAE